MPCDPPACGAAAPPGPCAGVPPLASLYMYVSGACNLSCRHCWISPVQGDAPGPSLHMSPEVARSAVEQAVPLGLASVKLTGGEPLLNPAFGEIVHMVAEHGIQLVVETNGTLLTESTADLLAGCGVLRSISVSVDGATAETHEALRGVPGCFGRAMEGIGRLVGRGIRPQLICTLHKGNAGEVTDVIDMAERLGCGSVKFNHIQPIGRGGDVPGEELLEPRDLLRAGSELAERASKPGPRIILHLPPAFLPPGYLFRQGCSRCDIHTVLGILHTGEISICGAGVSLPGLVFGDIRSDGLEEVWRSAPVLREIRETIPSGLGGTCSRCIHRDFCRGDCVALNYLAGRSISSGNAFCGMAESLGLFPASRLRAQGMEGGRDA